MPWRRYTTMARRLCRRRAGSPSASAARSQWESGGEWLPSFPGVPRTQKPRITHRCVHLPERYRGAFSWPASGALLSRLAEIGADRQIDRGWRAGRIPDAVRRVAGALQRGSAGSPAIQPALWRELFGCPRLHAIHLGGQEARSACQGCAGTRRPAVRSRRGSPSLVWVLCMVDWPPPMTGKRSHARLTGHSFFIPAAEYTS